MPRLTSPAPARRRTRRPGAPPVRLPEGTPLCPCPAPALPSPAARRSSWRPCRCRGRLLAATLPAPAAHAWGTGGDRKGHTGYGTHDWVVDQAAAIATNDGWFNAAVARAHSGDPDVYYPRPTEHVFDGEGGRAGRGGAGRGVVRRGGPRLPGARLHEGQLGVRGDVALLRRRDAAVPLQVRGRLQVVPPAVRGRDLQHHPLGERRPGLLHQHPRSRGDRRAPDDRRRGCLFPAVLRQAGRRPLAASER